MSTARSSVKTLGASFTASLAGGMPWWGPAVLVGVPLALRLLLLAELSSSPFFRELFVDARTYHETAVRIAQGAYERHEPFWQPPLYPYFLALVYRIFSPSPLAARLVQALLGSLSTLLLFRIADRLFSRRAAWIAWGMAVVYAPLLFFDLQILNVGPAIFLLLLGINLALSEPPQSGGTGLRRAGSGFARPVAAGLALGLASITAATLLAALLPLAWYLARKRGARRGPAPFLAGAALPVVVVFISNLAVGGEPVLISYNGGVNFWIGNNPAYEQTVALRPGRGWVDLMKEPGEHGFASPSASSSYFLRKSGDWIRRRPLSYGALLLHKARLFLRGDEIPRNQETYPFRSSSLLLRLLLWIRGIAFPFGLLLPLAAAGMAALARRDGPGDLRGSAVGKAEVRLLFALVGVLSLAVIAFFVTERYRLPAVPLLILFAAAGIGKAVDRFRGGSRRALLAPAVAFLAAGIVSNTGLPAMPERFNSDAYSDLGTTYSLEGDLSSARAQFQTALEVDPENLEALHNLGAIALKEKKPDEAERLFRRVIESHPKDPNALKNLGNAAYQKGDPWRAGWFYQRAAEADPARDDLNREFQAFRTALDRVEDEAMRARPDGFLREMEGRAARDPENAFLRARLARLRETGR